MPWGLITSSLWLAWLIYWMVSAVGNKVTRRRESFLSGLAYRIPTVISIFLLLPHRHSLWLSHRFLPPIDVFHWLGVGILAFGLGFSVWARVHLARNWSGTVTLKENHELIRTGPYRYVRHPIYTGLLLGVLGSAIVGGERHGLLAVGFLVLGFVIKLRMEERWMGETFGEQYAQYKKEVAALIPGIF
jgi:protein-S-isoprenylcysteine O-methyltransferase Ste14